MDLILYLRRVAEGKVDPHAVLHRGLSRGPGDLFGTQKQHTHTHTFEMQIIYIYIYMF
eukprot:COSAG06_NODE_2540_length_6706_cov_9.446647_7_plen_58_part_00